MTFMATRLQIVCLLFCTLWQPCAQAERKITANALFTGRAVLLVDGETVLFATGESQRGITLIDANESRAVIKVEGEERTLYLDKGRVVEEYAKSENSKKNSTAKSHIIDAMVIHQTANLATFEVEYFYNKNLGERVTLSAKTLQLNKPTDYWVYTHTALLPGRNFATITVSMNNKAPASYNSDAIRFDMNWVKGQESGSTGTLIFPFIKTWKQ
ncbi:MAG TPA: hypothetical protein VGL10_10135 [Gammaproteobacteria bacterium]